MGADPEAGIEWLSGTWYTPPVDGLSPLVVSFVDDRPAAVAEAAGAGVEFVVRAVVPGWVPEDDRTFPSVAERANFAAAGPDAWVVDFRAAGESGLMVPGGVVLHQYGWALRHGEMVSMGRVFASEATVGLAEERGVAVHAEYRSPARGDGLAALDRAFGVERDATREERREAETELAAMLLLADEATTRAFVTELVVGGASEWVVPLIREDLWPRPVAGDPEGMDGEAFGEAMAAAARDAMERYPALVELLDAE